MVSITHELRSSQPAIDGYRPEELLYLRAADVDTPRCLPLISPSQGSKEHPHIRYNRPMVAEIDTGLEAIRQHRVLVDDPLRLLPALGTQPDEVDPPLEILVLFRL